MLPPDTKKTIVPGSRTGNQWEKFHEFYGIEEIDQQLESLGYETDLLMGGILVKMPSTDIMIGEEGLKNFDMDAFINAYPLEKEGGAPVCLSGKKISVKANFPLKAVGGIKPKQDDKILS